MIALFFSLGIIVGFLGYGFMMKLPHEDIIDFHFKVYRVYEKSYQKWIWYIANGLNNASDETIQALLQDLGYVTKSIAELVGEKDATLNCYLGEEKNDEH